MRIALIGFMGSGKTTIGRRLSEMLEYSFIDLDEEIEKAAHASPAELFKLYGEGTFRSIESKVLEQLGAADADFVLACGGGVVEQARNREVLRKHFLTVWLDVPFDEVARRLSGESGRRPLWTESDGKAAQPISSHSSLENKNEVLYNRRQALYAECADLVYRCEEPEGHDASALHVYELIEQRGG